MPLILTGTSSSATLDSSAGLTFSDSSNQSAAASPYVLKNRIINGGMDVWQRGTTYALTNTNAYGSVDRWAVFQSTTANGIANQVASGLTGFQYALKLGRNSSATTTGAIQMTQVLETVNSIPLAGQTVTFSFYAKAGANFSATSSNLGVYLATGTGTDQSSSSFTISGWTGNSALINTTQAITTTWTRYSFTTTIASTATQVGLQLYYSPTGTAGADDNVYITGVQLEIGTTATPFERRLYNQELANCQRYFEINKYQVGSQDFVVCTSPQNNNGIGIYPFKVSKRATPSTAYSALSDFTCFGSGYASLTPTALNFVSTTDYCAINPTIGSASFLVQGAYIVRMTGSNGFMSFSAEL
jgi:hypothetical protein